jgi:uncharacterized protein YcbX
MTSRVRSLTVWPVKSLGGGTGIDAVWVDEQGLAGDRAYAFVDQRPMRAGHVVSARNVPGLLRWSAEYPRPPQRDDVRPPVVTGPGGERFDWTDPALAGAVSDDVGVPLAPAPAGRYCDLDDSVLVTTQATHDDVEQLFGRRLERERWRTNLHLETDAPAFAEHGWEGRRLIVGDVELRLLHPCKRCTIPTWAPGGRERTPELLTWFHREHAGRFGINARVEVPGVLRADAEVRVEPPG